MLSLEGSKRIRAEKIKLFVELGFSLADATYLAQFGL